MHTTAVEQSIRHGCPLGASSQGRSRWGKEDQRVWRSKGDVAGATRV